MGKHTSFLFIALSLLMSCKQAGTPAKDILSVASPKLSERDGCVSG